MGIRAAACNELINELITKPGGDVRTESIGGGGEAIPTNLIKNFRGGHGNFVLKFSEESLRP